MFVLVYAGGKWVNDGDVNAHAIMGAIVTGLAFIQPFMALFRCDPDSRYRFIFNYFHALVGTSALILSLATLFLATTNFKGIFSTHTGWILMTVWTCWLVCLCVVLECLQRWNPSDSTMLSKNYSGISTVNDQEMADASPHLGQILQPSTIQKQERWKMILFLLHLSVAVGISIALVITIATFDWGLAVNRKDLSRIITMDTAFYFIRENFSVLLSSLSEMHMTMQRIKVRSSNDQILSLRIKSEIRLFHTPKHAPSSRYCLLGDCDSIVSSFANWLR